MIFGRFAHIARAGGAAAFIAASMSVGVPTANATVFTFSGVLDPCAEVGGPPGAGPGTGDFTANLGPGGVAADGDGNPCGNSDNSGTFSGSYDDDTKLFSYEFEYTGLTAVPGDDSPFTNFHFHVGEPDENGVILIDGNLAAPPSADSNPISDTIEITSALTSIIGLTIADFEAALTSGGIYLNIHSDAFTQGELRGNIVTEVDAPGALAIFGLGLIGLGAWRRRRAA